MIMKRIDCWERSLAIRNQEISRNSGIGIDIKGDFLRLISVSLFLTEHFHIPRCSAFGGVIMHSNTFALAAFFHFLKFLIGLFPQAIG